MTALHFRRVGHTRGPAVADLAAVLAEGPPIAVDRDLKRSCLEHRLDLLVARRQSSFDLVPAVVPHRVDITRTAEVVGAVAGGPHSPAVAALVARIAAGLGVRGVIATVARTDDERPAAEALLASLALDGVEQRLVEVEGVRHLTSELPRDALLVVGAPGGSWLQRQLFGAGHRLLVAAPGGTVVVQSSPRRCFQEARDPAGAVVSPVMRAADAAAVIKAGVLPVADRGILVGVARRARLLAAADGFLVGDAMEPPVSVGPDHPVGAAVTAATAAGGWPVPVVDESGLIVGVVDRPARG